MNLVTVCGHNTTMLYHMLRHYKPIVKHFFVVIYGHHKDDPVIEEAKSICSELGIQIIDGLGDKIQSSSWLLKK